MAERDPYRAQRQEAGRLYSVQNTGASGYQPPGGLTPDQAATSSTASGAMLDPNTYLPSAHPDTRLPKWAQSVMYPTPPTSAYATLPTGLGVDPSMPSAVSSVRMAQVREFRLNPGEYIRGNATALIQEQSLMDKGMSLLGNIFNYEDDADLSIFGVPLSPIESVWDGALRYTTGAYNALNSGMAALVSAAPGGNRTLEWSDVAGGKSFWEVMHGDHYDAPSIGQVFVSGVAQDIMKIRSGQMSLPGALAASAGSGIIPLLAGLAAETSPLQSANFNLMDKAQRDEAFSQGWEKWASGVTDFGMMFADPAIGAGVALKFARLGMLGAKGPSKYLPALASAVESAADKKLAKMGLPSTREILREGFGTADSVQTHNRYIASLARQPVTIQSPTSRAARTYGMQVLDDEHFWSGYTRTTRDEFRRMISNDDPASLDGAIQVWRDYVDNLYDGGHVEVDPADVMRDARYWQDTYGTNAEDALHEYTTSLVDNAPDSKEIVNGYNVDWLMDNFFTDPASVHPLLLRGGKPNEIKDALQLINDAPDYAWAQVGGDEIRDIYRDLASRSEVSLIESGEMDYFIRIRDHLARETEIDTPLRARPAEVPEFEPNPVGEATLSRYTPDGEKGYVNAVEPIFDAVLAVDEVGVKINGPDVLRRMLGFRNTPYADAVVGLLYRVNDPLTLQMVFRSLHGDHSVDAILRGMKSSLYDEMYRLRAQQTYHYSLQEPAKRMQARAALDQSQSNLQEVLEHYWDQMSALSPESPEYMRMEFEVGNIRGQQDQLAALEGLLEGQTPDFLPRGPLHDADLLEQMLKETETSIDTIDIALREDLHDVMSALAPERRVPVKSNIYAKAVASHRVRSAIAGAQYAKEGMGIFPKAVHVGTLIDEGATEGNMVTGQFESSGWFSKSHFDGVSRLRRASRVWRFAGSESPSGYIGLKGTSAVQADRELLAALDLRMYKGDGVQVTHMTPGADPEIVNIGGDARLKEIMDIWHAAAVDPFGDRQAALNVIEKMIQEDFTKAYGANEGRVKDVFNRADRIRGELLDDIREGRAVFVDHRDGTKHHIPYLKHQLANGTYMHNYHAIEDLFRRSARREAGGKYAVARDYLRGVGNWGYAADDVFQKIWRPATLFRLSYTQRNVFEGLIRSMAHLGSLTPLTWPVRATYYGVAAKVKKGAAERGIARAYERTASLRTENPIAQNDYIRARLNSELADHEWRHTPVVYDPENGDLLDQAGNFRVTQYDSEYGVNTAHFHTLSQMDEFRGNVNHEYNTMLNELDQVELMFDEAVDGTSFGKWRKVQISGIEEEIKRQSDILDSMRTSLRDLDPQDQAMSLYIGRLEMQYRDEVQTLIQREWDLRYNPDAALPMYRQQAERQRRIGTGTSMAPDGSMQGDAFHGVGEAMNRSLLSADNTTKQGVSMRSGVWGNALMETLVKTNEAIPWAAGRENEWYAGMANVINQLVNNTVVRILMDENGGVEKALQWMTRTEEGRKYVKTLSHLFDDDINLEEMSRASGIFTEDRLKPFAFDAESPVTGEKFTRIDENGARAYLSEVMDRIDSQMQGYTPFTDLLIRRTREMQVENLSTVTTPEEIRQIVDSLTPAQRAGLGYVQGDAIVQMGGEKFLKAYSKMVNAAFRTIGTIPEDAVVRAPYYNERFKRARNILIEQYWYNEGMDITVVRARNSYGATQPFDIEHPPFEIPKDRLQDIIAKAHAQALSDTREYMYTIERRTKLGKYGEAIFPFISATQNTFTAGGKILWENPWVAPVVADLWRAPERLGIADENGNIHMPMPVPWLRDFLKDRPDIPVLGGILDDMDSIVIPKNGINVFMPDTGFGLAPRPTPLVQVAASELMKWGAFPVETPAIVKSALGEEEGNAFYQSIKDYIFGDQGTMSSKFLSWDLLAPATAKRFIEMHDEMSNQYGYQFNLQWQTQTSRYKAGERDDAPTPEEIHKRTTNMFWFMAMGNIGIPTPYTPYPILTRPQVTSPIELLQEQYRKYLQADGKNAALNFDRDYGDWAMEMAQTQITKSVGGADSTMATASDIQTLDPLIRDVAPLLGDAHMDLLDILVNNRNTSGDYNDSAYQWERARTIGGTDRQWRENQSPEQSELERQRLAGWTEYQKFMDGLDAQLTSAGFTNYSQSAAAPYRQARDRFIANMALRKDRQGWWMDYQDPGGARTQNAIMVMEKAVSSPEFQRLMLENNKSSFLTAMSQYVYYRRGVINEMARSGLDWNSVENTPIRDAWLSIRQKLGDSDVRFSEILNRWLATDENPRFPGDYLPSEMAMMEVGQNG